MNKSEGKANLAQEKIKKVTLGQLKYPLEDICLRDIAEKAGVSENDIYTYFDNKENLIRETVKYFYRIKIDDHEKYLTGDLSFKEKIHFMIAEKKDALHTLSLDVASKVLLEDDEIKKFIENEYTVRIIPLMTNLINSGKESGEISKDTSVQSVMLFMNMFKDQAKTSINFLGAHKNKDKAIDEVMHLFFWGICGNPAK